MSDNMFRDLARGASHFNKLWLILLWVDIIGWFLALNAGLLAVMPIIWFVWVIPLSLILFIKAMLCYFNNTENQ